MKSLFSFLLLLFPLTSFGLNLILRSWALKIVTFCFVKLFEYFKILITGETIKILVNFSMTLKLKKLIWNVFQHENFILKTYFVLNLILHWNFSSNVSVPLTLITDFICKSHILWICQNFIDADIRKKEIKDGISRIFLFYALSREILMCFLCRLNMLICYVLRLLLLFQMTPCERLLFATIHLSVLFILSQQENHFPQSHFLFSTFLYGMH